MSKSTAIPGSTPASGSDCNSRFPPRYKYRATFIGCKRHEVGMSGMTGAGGATETLLNMIELFADPKAAKARVLELQEAAKKAQASIDDATARERNSQLAEQRAQGQRADLSAAIAVHNQNVARFEATRDQTNVALGQRETAVKELEKK